MKRVDEFTQNKELCEQWFTLPCAWCHRTTVFFKTVTFQNRSVLARVWSEDLWEETQCSLRILIPCLLLAFLLFYWEENLEVAEAAYCNPSVGGGGSVCSIARTLDSKKSLDFNIIITFNLSSPNYNLSTQKSPAWKWERILTPSWNSCRKTLCPSPTSSELSELVLPKNHGTLIESVHSWNSSFQGKIDSVK